MSRDDPCDVLLLEVAILAYCMLCLSVNLLPLLTSVCCLPGDNNGGSWFGNCLFL